MSAPPVSIFQQAHNGNIQVKVDSDNETVWLTQVQLVDLLHSSKANISEHIKNIYASGELDQEATVRKFRTVRKEGNRQVTRNIEHYNLDLIISLGYRVNTKVGIQFRKWANTILKNYLIQGYAINQEKLRQQTSKLKELEKAAALLNQTRQKHLASDEAKGLLDVVSNYLNSFVLLNQYDTDSLALNGTTRSESIEINHDQAITIINQLKRQLIAKNEATVIFGQQKDDNFKGILLNIIQSFGGDYLYPSIEEQAAHLLYFIIKNHPFVDGNKRIGSLMFVWFLDLNNHLLQPDSETKINDNALVALALLVAQSQPDQKAIMIKLIINLIKNKQGTS